MNNDVVQSLIRSLPVPAFFIGGNHKLLYWNRSLEDLFGINEKEIISTKQHWKIFYKNERPCLADLLLDGNIDDIKKWSKDNTVIIPTDETCETIEYFPFLDDIGKWLHVTASIIRDSIGDVAGVIQYFNDVTKQKSLEESEKEAKKKLIKEREQLIKLLTFLRRADIKSAELTSFVAEECVNITQSELGFFGFMNDDETEMTAHLWSERAMKHCAIDNKPMKFPVETAGIWAESIRTHQMFIDNDFSKPDPRKKGYPVGHVPIHRYLTIPVIRENKVVAVLGLANKKHDYTEDDSIRVGLFIENIWALIKKKEAEIELQMSMHKLEKQHEQLKSTQAQLIQSEKMASLGTLVAGVAHEINNPIHYVYLSSKSLERDILSFKENLIDLLSDNEEEIIHYLENVFEKFRQPLQYIMEGSSRIKTIIEDLRTFSRLDEAEKKDISIADALESTLRLVKTQYNKQVEFICDFKTERMLECYPSKINQVFMNIIVNACQAICKKQEEMNDQNRGKVKISLKDFEKEIKITFEDDGCGMTEKERKKAFEPFFTTKPVGHGTGLGLSISYSIIEMHKGRIEIESQPGIGTTVTVFIPSN